ncbi:hypothetical protein JMJ55_00480 [Belnapia sp. T6]|uniref:Uncharacterized protein n=1 Tax=Belnapia mucosa TaxID=2804532 RepID=A0ABS1UWC0_9PROT|nr:hypothetical protein [Belnapia mucosa]MBL6453774.1 hypothetical protein [Belnapia mucosa]
MAWTVDARIPLRLVADAAGLSAALAAGPPAAVLAEAPAPASPGGVALMVFEGAEAHPAACTCCAGRPAAAVALDRLFQARVRGQSPWFDRVVALAGSDAGRAQVQAALAGDAVTAARFRAG